MQIIIKNPEILFQFSEVLKNADLVPEGLEKDNLYLFCAKDESEKIIGTIGVEVYGDSCLLRSLAVQADKRNQGIAHALLQEAFEFAVSVKSYDLYLITETIGARMIQYGFQNQERNKVPHDLLQSPFFNGICSCSCQLMHKNISS